MNGKIKEKKTVANSIFFLLIFHRHKQFIDVIKEENHTISIIAGTIFFIFIICI